MARRFTSSEIEHIFSKLDKDGNGKIDSDEMSIYLLSLGLPASKKDISNWFSAVDANGDGIVNLLEFQTFIRAREALLIDTFERLDLDKDGLLSSKELLNGMQELGIEKVTEREARKFIRTIQSEKKGVDQVDGITFSEFQQFLMAVPHLTVTAAFDQWMRATAIDVGEDVIVPDEGERKDSPLVTFLAGGIAGAFSRTTTAPLDRIKVMFQAGSAAGVEVKGIGPMIRQIFQEGGARAFFRGNGTNVLKIAPESALKFYVYALMHLIEENTKHFFCKDPTDITIPQRLAAGATAGVASQSFIYPLETVKTRMAVSPAGTYRGISHCLATVIKKEGFFALYRGLTPSLLGIVPYAGVDLCMFSYLKERYSRLHPGEDPGVGVLLSCGAFSSTCGQIVSYPLALVRTKLQAQGIGGGKKVYTGMSDCFLQTVKQDGPLGLYRGILPNFMKAIPAISISYAVYEKTKLMLRQASENR